MIKVHGLDVIVSKGYQDAPDLKFVSMNNGGEMVQFRVGSKEYDPEAADKTRWINFTVKAFDSDLVSKIKLMKLKAKSRVHIYGRLDVETWEDDDGSKHQNTVIIAKEIEFGGGGNGDGKKNGDGTKAQQQQPAQQQQQGYQPQQQYTQQAAPQQYAPYPPQQFAQQGVPQQGGAPFNPAQYSGFNGFVAYNGSGSQPLPPNTQAS